MVIAEALFDGDSLLFRLVEGGAQDASMSLRVLVLLLAGVLWWRLWLLIKAKLEDREGGA